jgi:uncharacterized membrane protein
MGKEVLRFWEVDALRGIAVLMMIAFHALFDLSYFGVSGVDVYSGFWMIFARATLIIFLVLVGISLSISHSRVEDKLNRSQIIRKYTRRGLRIFLYGIAITAVTFAAFPSSAIWFGILHLIGASIVLAIPLLTRRRIALAAGVLMILSGLALSTQSFGFPWLMPLGFYPAGFYSFDYVPLLPWFGVVLLGLFAGGRLYEKRKPKETPHSAGPICFIGRHSLFIYLVHQPVMVGLIVMLLA